ncbi:uncharacterized protein LOC113489115 [Athene cunicularia]|nr:uncharacterized protein LOC113489115 [Athene cunicularia]
MAVPLSYWGATDWTAVVVSAVQSQEEEFPSACYSNNPPHAAQDAVGRPLPRANPASKDQGEEAVEYLHLSYKPYKCPVGYFALEVSLQENYCLTAVTVGLGRCRSSIKASPSPHSLIHSSQFHLLGNKVIRVNLYCGDMSCNIPCMPCLPCQPCGPTPLANSCNEPCVRQCQDSTVVIQPSPVVVTLPGPILSSFPQSTAVGSSTSAAVGSILSSEGVPISSGGFGLSGLGSRLCGRRCLPC